ncbi:glycosyl transferase family 1 [Sulfolobales archaeon HS-7]|nr:glycosyl transferase family 1 [Sulfolobales archaeon HS-7]
MNSFTRTLRIVIELLPRALAYREIRRSIKNGRPIPEKEQREEAKKFVNSLIRLGPSFIKFGQILSVRSDIMPESYLLELRRLQDEVPPAPFDQIIKIVKEEVPDLEIERESIAAASLGEVHRGKYRGMNVVAKVNRPNIEEILKTDIAIIKRLLPVARLIFDASLVESLKVVVEQFTKKIFEEIDYEKEAFYMEKIRDELRDFRVRIPKLILAKKKVLVMEYLPGHKVTSDEAYKIVNRKSLAWRVFRIFITPVLTQRYFHADPHPGNIAVDNEGNIILYDFGMVDGLDSVTRVRLIRLYIAISRGDPIGVVNVLDELGAIQPDADRRVLVKGFELLMKELQGIRVEEMELEDFQRIANDAFYRFPLRLPSRLAIYFRMSAVLEGTCTEIDPDFDFFRSLVTIVQDEGLLREAYFDELRNTYNKVINAIRLSMLEKPTQRKRRDSYWIGVLAIGVSIAIYLITKNEVLPLLVAILGLGISLSAR